MTYKYKANLELNDFKVAVSFGKFKVTLSFVCQLLPGDMCSKLEKTEWQ